MVWFLNTAILDQEESLVKPACCVSQGCLRDHNTIVWSMATNSPSQFACHSISTCSSRFFRFSCLWYGPALLGTSTAPGDHAPGTRAVAGAPRRIASNKDARPVVL